MLLPVIAGACSGDDPSLEPLPEVVSANGMEIMYTRRPDVVDHDSYFVVNEDWYGQQNGSVNRFWNDGTITYRAFRKANPDGTQLGVTSQYGMSFAGKYFFMSKQGNRFVVTDKELRCLAKFRILGTGTEQDGGDGRACVGVDEHKVYVGSSNKIHIFDLDKMCFTGVVKGFEGDADLYEGQVGDMVKIGKRVFAAIQGAGVAVIDTDSDYVEKIIEKNSYGGLAVSKNGVVWIAGNPVCGYNPYTLEKVCIVEKGDLSAGGGCGWGAWHSCTMFASSESNTLYWWTSGGSLGVACGGDMVRYDIDRDELTRITSGTSYALFRSQPITDYIAGVGALYDTTMNRVASWRIRGGFAGSDGIADDEREEYPWWFPTLPMFEDNNVPCIIVHTIKIPRDKISKICLSEMFVDYDNPPRLASKDAFIREGSKVKVEINSDTLYLDARGCDIAMNDALKLKVCSNGLVAESDIEIIVK